MAGQEKAKQENKMNLDFLKITLKNLKNRKLRSYLTLIGIFIGIAAVVSLIGLGEGLRTAITAQFNFIGADKITIQATGSGNGPPGTGVQNPLKEDYLRGIQNINGVKLAVGRLVRFAEVKFNERTELGFAASVPDSESRRVLYETLNLKTTSGRLLKDGDEKYIMIGSSVNDKNVWKKEMRVGDQLQIQGRDYTIVGILKKQGSYFTDSAIYMNEKPMKDAFGISGVYDIIVAQVYDKSQINEVKARIENYLRKQRDVKQGEEDFEVQTAENILRNVNSTILGVQIFVYIIAAISLLVGGIGITNTMYASVVERTKEIGIMKAIGATRHDIFTLFFIESGFLGMLGGILGIIIGSAMAYGGAFAIKTSLGLDLIQASISWWLILGAIGFSFVIGVLSGLLPAVEASKKQPVESLRQAK